MKRLLLLLPLLLVHSAAFAFWGKQEPWATPKGDARVDCAVWKAKSERHNRLRAIEDRINKAELNKTMSMIGSKTEEEVNEYWERDSNPAWKAKKDEEESLVELQLAEMNVVKHLGYSKDRLKEMWDWRQSNGVKYKEHDFQKDDFRILFEKRWSWSEIKTFCENI